MIEDLGRKGRCEWPHLVNCDEQCPYPSFPEGNALGPHRSPVLTCKKVKEKVRRDFKV